MGVRRSDLEVDFLNFGPWTPESANVNRKFEIYAKTSPLELDSQVWGSQGPRKTKENLRKTEEEEDNLGNKIRKL